MQQIISLDEARIDLKNLTRDELLALKHKIDIDINRIKLQLDNAKADLVKTGVYADPHWYANAKFALKMKARESQLVQFRLGQMKRSWANDIGQAFIEVASRRLETIVFHEIMQEAKDIVKNTD